MYAGNTLLSYGEYLHCNGDFTSAKDVYELAVKASSAKDISREYFLASANMVPEEVSLAGTCALGQLLSRTGYIDLKFLKSFKCLILKTCEMKWNETWSFTEYFYQKNWWSRRAADEGTDKSWSPFWFVYLPSYLFSNFLTSVKQILCDYGIMDYSFQVQVI